MSVRRRVAARAVRMVGGEMLDSMVSVYIDISILSIRSRTLKGSVALNGGVVWYDNMLFLLLFRNSI